eukprot:scaffold23510_cov115-Cylindrotheca_fusiformis.AAC.5
MMGEDMEWASPIMAAKSNLSFLEELDEAAAKLDDELKAISNVNQDSTSSNQAGGDTSHLYYDEDDDDLTDELASLEYSKLALQQELNLSTLSFEDFNGGILSPIHNVPELHWEETPEQESEMKNDSLLEDEEGNQLDAEMVSDLQVSLEDDDHLNDEISHQAGTDSSGSPFRPEDECLDTDISPVKIGGEKDECSSTTRSRTEAVDSSAHSSMSVDNENDMTPRIHNTSFFSNMQDEESSDNDCSDFESVEPTQSNDAVSPLRGSSLKILQQVGSPSSGFPTLIPTYSEEESDDENEQNHTQPLHIRLQQQQVFRLHEQETTEEPSRASNHGSANVSTESSKNSKKKKKWLPRRFFTSIATANKNENRNRPILKAITNSIEAKRKLKPKRTSTTATGLASSRLSTVSEDSQELQAHVPTASKKVAFAPTSKDQILFETNNPLLFLQERERVVVENMMKMLHSQEAKNKEQEKRERKLLHMLRDAWLDKKNLVAIHKKEMQQLKAQHQDALGNYELLQEENELLILQTQAWKEISRQSNHQVAAYKHSYDELQLETASAPKVDDEEKLRKNSEQLVVHQDVHPGKDEVEIESLKRELVQVRQHYKEKLATAHQEKKNLDQQFRQERLNHQMKLDEASIQTELAQQDLKHLQSGYERKLETIIREKNALKAQMNEIHQEYERKLHESKQSAANVQLQLQELQDQARSKEDQLKTEYQKAELKFDIANIRTKRLEQELSDLQRSQKEQLEKVEHLNILAKQALGEIETKYEFSNAKRLEAEQALLHVQDLLSIEAADHSDVKMSFQQQQDILRHDNLSLQKKLEDTQLELQYAQENYVKQEMELRNQRKQVDRLLEEASNYQDLEAQYQQSLEDVKCHRYTLSVVQEELKAVRANGADAQEASDVTPVASAKAKSLEQSPLQYELQVAETKALQDQVNRLKIALKASTPIAYSALGNRKSPVEERIRKQVQRLRKSLTPKHDDNSVVFWSEEDSVVAEEERPAKIPSPKIFIDRLRPKSKDRSKQVDETSVDKENNGLKSIQRRGGGLGVRTTLSIR